MNKRQRKKAAKAQVREALDRRYDDIKTGRVKLVSWEEVEGRLVTSREEAAQLAEDIKQRGLQRLKETTK